MRSGRPSRGLLAVLVVAAAARVLVGLDAQDAPFWTTPVVDELEYMRTSERMVLGQDPPHGAYYVTPGYAWFLAALVSAGMQLPGVKVVQLLLGVANAGLLFVLGRRWFDARVGTIAGIAWAIAPTVLLHELLILKPTLTVFLSLLALFALGRERSGKIAWTLGGLALGATAVVRGEMLLVGLLLVALGVVAARRAWTPAPASTTAPLLGLLALLAVVAIPTAQNMARGGGFVVIAYGGGPNFYIGNNPRADGSYVPLRPGRSDAAVEEDDAVRIARENSTLALDAAGVSRFWWGEGLAWWGDEPGAALALTAKKAVLLWSAWEGNDVHSLAIARRWVTLLGNPIVRPWLVFPLALAGLFWLRPWRRNWVLVAFVSGSWMAVVPFFVFERFRLPLFLGAIVLASAFVVHAIDAWRAGRRVPVATAGAIALALVFLLALPRVARDESVLHVNVGSMLLQQGRWQDALEEFDTVLRLSPDTQRVHINRATALHRLGRDQQAMQALDAALAALYAEARATGRPPVEELGYCHELAGDIAAARKRPNEAMRHYQAVLRLAPGHPRVQQKVQALGRDG